MLREPQHERGIVNVINIISVRPFDKLRAGSELSRRAISYFFTHSQTSKSPSFPNASIGNPDLSAGAGGDRQTKVGLDPR